MGRLLAGASPVGPAPPGRVPKQLSRDALLMSLGAAKEEAGHAWRLVTIHLPEKDQPVTTDTFRYELNRGKLRQTIRREGRYLLLTRIEQAFQDLKGDLAIRPIHHQIDARIEAHIFLSFLAYCRHATLRNLARNHAGGLTPRAILEKLSALQMIDVHLPTTDGKHIVLSRYTEPEADVALLLAQLQLTLPAQSPPKVHASEKVAV